MLLYRVDLISIMTVLKVPWPPRQLVERLACPPLTRMCRARNMWRTTATPARWARRALLWPTCTASASWTCACSTPTATPGISWCAGRARRAPTWARWRALDEAQLSLVPIDHGFCLPEALEPPYLEWQHWPQARSPMFLSLDKICAAWPVQYMMCHGVVAGGAGIG